MTKNSRYKNDNRIRSRSPAVKLDNPLMGEFLQMLTYRRPADSTTEAEFITKYVDSLPGMQCDVQGNRFLKIGTKPVVWSCHTDTVHKNGGRQRITVGDGIVSLSQKELISNCLGADCTVGVWLMRQMIQRGVEGLYIFHAAEEVGGLGSDYIARKTPELLEGYNYAIAFDRKGYRSIITHQMTRCCSDGFAKVLNEGLGGGFELDDTGTFTDTANYTGLISECTNISVGYFDQHSSAETTDVYFAFELLEKICALDVDALPVLRDPTAVSDYSDWGGYGRWFGSGDKDYSSYGTDAGSAGSYADTGAGKAPYSGGKHTIASSKGRLEDLCFEYPDVAAMILEEMGMDEDTFEKVLDEMGYNWRGPRKR
jgi:hypothetical protein